MDIRDLLRARPLVASHLKKDFAAFCRAAWPVLHPGTKLSWTPGHDLICEHLVAVWQGQTKRMLINCPPRFAKSSILNCFAVWVWLQDPTRSFLCCSYEIDLALNGNQDRRRLLESKWFRDLFGDAVTLSIDRAQAGDFQNTAGGQMQAASTNSKAQGRGGDFILIDDPNSADFIYSDSFRNETNFWLEHQLPQRLNDPSQSAIVLVQQRLHQEDCTGFLLSQEESPWTLLKLALVAEEDETWTFPVSGRVWKRRKGECLDPKRWSPRAVRDRQRNRLVFAGQFQQSPMAASGNVIRTDDILYYGGRDPKTGAMDPGLPESFERKIISVDCSFKDLRTSDFVAVIVVGIVGSRRYLLHVTNAHLDLTGTENEIRNCRATFAPISATLVEDKANGSSVIAHLKEEIPGLIAVNPEGGKMARLVAAAPEFQANNWIIDRNGPWTHKVIEQLTMFPNCKHDDICDAVSQCAIWVQSHSYELTLIAGLKERGPDWLRGIFRRKSSITKAAEESAIAPANCTWCGSANMEAIGTGDSMRWSCRDCKRTSVTQAEVGDACPFKDCTLKLQPVPGGGVRCQNHGQLPSPDRGGPKGISRREHFRRLGSYAIRGPRGRF
jgi:predicted phage terminase large subunit-like protein